MKPADPEADIAPGEEDSELFWDEQEEFATENAAYADDVGMPYWGPL